MPTVTINDPKYLDGEPHEVAAIAGEQLTAVLLLAADALAGFKWAARNAWLSAEHHRTKEMPWADDFDDVAAGKRLRLAENALGKLDQEIEVLTKAASFNPRATN